MTAESDIRTSSTPPKTKIFVGRLPEDANPMELRRLFEQYGVVTECDILNRYGFVHMKTEEMATRAIQELNNADFMGVPISVEQSTGKRSGRGGGGGGMSRGGFGPMRGRGAMRGMMRGHPYMRDGRGDFDRRPGLPPPPMRNGYYDGYDRGYDAYYTSRPMPPMLRDRYFLGLELPSFREPERRTAYPDMMRASPYERRSPYDRPTLPPIGGFERRSDYGVRMASDMYRRRTPPPASSYSPYRDMDPYGPPARRYPAPSPLDRDLPPPRRF